MNEAIARKLIRARTALYIDHPFYGILALRLTMKEDPSIKTLCVNAKEIRYNPDFVTTLDDDTTKSAVAHEVGHIFWDHLDRCAGRNPKKWNAAGDYVINAGLKEDKMRLGPGWLYSKAFEGKHADEIYTLLPDEPTDDDGGWGELDAMEPSNDPEDAAEAKLDWQIAAISAAKIAEAQGKLPTSMKRLVDQLTNNKVDWRERLRNFITSSSDADYSWTHPQRRMLPYGYILPSLHSEAMGLIVNAIDTSGSISDYILQAFGAEIIAIRGAVCPEQLINIYCDAEVAHVDTYDQFEEITFEGHGGGGTDFKPPFEHVEKEGLKPECFIYLTDGYGPFPDAPPPYPVLWVMTTDVTPPWGEYVRIEV